MYSDNALIAALEVSVMASDVSCLNLSVDSSESQILMLRSPRLIRINNHCVEI